MSALSASEKLRALCVGHPHAKISWPHRDLHEAAATIDNLIEALKEAREYFAERADAEYFTDSASPQGNTEMGLLVHVTDALEKAGAL